MNYFFITEEEEEQKPGLLDWNPLQAKGSKVFLPQGILNKWRIAPWECHNIRRWVDTEFRYITRPSAEALPESCGIWALLLSTARKYWQSHKSKYNSKKVAGIPSKLAWSFCSFPCLCHGYTVHLPWIDMYFNMLY